MYPLALLTTALLLGTPTAEAQTYGGAGVIAHPSAVYTTPRNYAGGYDISPPGLMQCIGGQGYLSVKGHRWGGEGRLCGGRRGAMGFGGVQSGWQSRYGGLYAMAYGTVGGGWMHTSGYDGVFDATYLYLQPSVGVGVPIGGHVALEASLYWMWTVPMVQRVNHVDVRSQIPNPVGVQLSVLVGDFRKRDRVARSAPTPPSPPAPPPPPAAPAPPPPPAAHPPPPGQPAPIQPGDATESPNQGAPPRPEDEAPEERPLAIPAGAI